MLRNYLAKEGIDFDIQLHCFTKKLKTDIESPSAYLVKKEIEYQAFCMNDLGAAFVFFRKTSEIDRAFWKEERNTNDKVNQLREQIKANLNVGYMWNVKRTVGQSAMISIYYGFLAIAIAVLTDGILYSDDGGWDYKCFPIEAKPFMNEYLNLSKLQDKDEKEFFERCLQCLKDKRG